VITGGYAQLLCASNKSCLPCGGLWGAGPYEQGYHSLLATLVLAAYTTVLANATPYNNSPAYPLHNIAFGSWYWFATVHAEIAFLCDLQRIASSLQQSIE
jgi:hypothetical protein